MSLPFQYDTAVSYTHLDVYKRQICISVFISRKGGKLFRAVPIRKDKMCIRDRNSAAPMIASEIAKANNALNLNTVHACLRSLSCLLYTSYFPFGYAKRRKKDKYGKGNCKR